MRTVCSQILRDGLTHLMAIIVPCCRPSRDESPCFAFTNVNQVDKNEQCEYAFHKGLHLLRRQLRDWMMTTAGSNTNRKQPEFFVIEAKTSFQRLSKVTHTNSHTCTVRFHLKTHRFCCVCHLSGGVGSKWLTYS